MEIHSILQAHAADGGVLASGVDLELGGLDQSKHIAGARRVFLSRADGCLAGECRRLFRGALTLGEESFRDERLLDLAESIEDGLPQDRRLLALDSLRASDLTGDAAALENRLR